MVIDVGIFRFNLQPLFDFFQQPAGEIIFQLFLIVGWVPFVAMMLFVVKEFYASRRQDKATKDWKWVLLAIDIPPMNVQTPLAVEQMFAHLGGALGSPSLLDKLHGGFKQRYYSFEIISIEGYIQFLVRTEIGLRDLVETAIYAQYSEAEIIEVEDYTSPFPNAFPNPDFDMWAADFGLAENDAYPIRTYREFEHNISKDTVLKDPMGTFLESFSRIGPGEQMWFQIIVEPTDNSWKEKAITKIKEVIGDTSAKKSKKTIFDALSDSALKIIETTGDNLFSREASEKKEVKREGPANNLGSMTPGQMNMVEDMEKKISKIGMKTKMRGVYVARKEVFKPERGVHAMIGAINQFNIPSENSIVPTTSTGNNSKKMLLMSAFKKRKMKMGGKPFILNIEELATIWHFPMSHVKTPLVQKAEGKRSEPPAGLPVGALVQPWDKPAIIPGLLAESENTGYTTDAGDIDNDQEMKFG